MSVNLRIMNEKEQERIKYTNVWQKNNKHGGVLIVMLQT